MPYVDGFIAAVPTDNRNAYIEHAKKSWLVFQELGAIAQWECWGDDISEGEVTSFPMAVKAKEDETIVFSWIAWLDKEKRDEGWEKMMSDISISEKIGDMPFDGQRIIYGGFIPIMSEGMQFLTE